MGKLHVVGTFPSIDPAKLNEFKTVAAQAVEVAKREEGTLQYEYFMSADETTCVKRTRVPKRCSHTWPD